MNQHFIVSENVRFDVSNNNKGESLKNARIGHLAGLPSDVNHNRANVYISENDRSELINGDSRYGRETQPKSRYSNIEEGLESSVSNEAKDRINRIVGDVKSLSDVEKLLLYLRLPTGDTSKDLRQTPTSCLQTSNRTEQAQAYTWIRSHLEEDVEICLPKQEVYDDYRVYCENHGIRPLSTADFGKLMKCVFPNVKPRRLGQRGQSRYCYGGLRKKLDIEAPNLPDLEISPHKQQDAGSEDDELYSASCQLVCEWAQKLLEQSFPSVRELAEHLVSHLYVNSKSVSAFTVVAGMQDSGIQNMKVSSMFSNTTGGDRHRETQLQLQRKLHEREQLREHKKKLQMQKEENEQKAKEAQDRMTPSLTSPTLLRALTSPARRIFDKKDEDSSLVRSKSVLSGKTKQTESIRSKSSLAREKMSQKQTRTCQEMDVEMPRSSPKGQGHNQTEAMDTDVQIPLTSPNPIKAKEQTDKKNSKSKPLANDSGNLEIGKDDWNVSLMASVLDSVNQTTDTWNIGQESPGRPFHTIMKPAAVSKHRTQVDSAASLVKVLDTEPEQREISLSPDAVEDTATEQNSTDNSHELVPKFDAMETVENMEKLDECLLLSSSVSSSSSSSMSSSVSSRSAFVPFSQMGTRKENDMLSMRIPSSTSSMISVVTESDVPVSANHPSQPGTVISSSNIPQIPSIPSSESQTFSSTEDIVKPPRSLSLNLNSPSSINVSYPACSTVGLLSAMSDIPSSQALPQTSPSTPKKTKSRFTPIRPKASPSKTVSNILKEKSTENSIYNKSKPVATLLKEKRAREAEVLAQTQINSGVTVSPGGVHQSSPGVQIQNIQNITASSLPKSLELNKPGEFFIILNPTLPATAVSKMSVVSPVSTVTQSFLSNTSTMTTSSKGKPDIGKGHRSVNPSRSRTNSSSESEIESIFPMGKESSGMISDSAEESFTDINMDETPSKLVKIDSDQGVSSRPGSRCSVDRETPSFGRKRKIYTCGNVSYHKRINSTDDTDDEVVIIDHKDSGKDSRRAKSCSLEQQDKDEIMSPMHKENLNHTIESIHCPDISILEIDALSDSGLDSEPYESK
ncbi:DNA-binding protein RFX7-like [Argopecten irradians]|uniref:DNA-binding protein RFX7-like n=1 Tax=Argopecten irradians TaxID=31199 RepID=UPI0037196AFE